MSSNLIALTKFQMERSMVADFAEVTIDGETKRYFYYGAAAEACRRAHRNEPRKEYRLVLVYTDGTTKELRPY